MKLGIFGDSFSSKSTKPKLYNGWPDLLELKFSTVENFSHVGTSIWWSFQHFLKHYKKFTHIIFCYSASCRYPAIPKDVWIGFHGDINGVNPSLKELSKYYLDIFPKNLLDFLNRAIALEIEKLCLENNIKLVHIFTEPISNAFITGHDNLNFPSIYGFSHVSNIEKVTYNGKIIKLHDLLFNEKNPKPDLRPCHFNSLNNELVFNIIENYLLTDKNEDTNFENLNWIITDPIVDNIYKNI